jgi:hypothetical protein
VLSTDCLEAFPYCTSFSEESHNLPSLIANFSILQDLDIIAFVVLSIVQHTQRHTETEEILTGGDGIADSFIAAAELFGKLDGYRLNSVWKAGAVRIGARCGK